MKILSLFFVVLLYSSRAVSDKDPDDVIQCHERFTGSTNRTYPNHTECWVERMFENETS